MKKHDSPPDYVSWQISPLEQPHRLEVKVPLAALLANIGRHLLNLPAIAELNRYQPSGDPARSADNALLERRVRVLRGTKTSLRPLRPSTR